ncbi:hypothetical protein K3495_g7941 [Podosphaera aphanis]|nr:hypothetical protein K3495_g7941 [Podosphaera aphanis]
MAKILVGGLSYATKDESFCAKFREFGEILEASIEKCPETGSSRGFGHVRYLKAQYADAAIAAMNEKEFEGRRLHLGRAVG